MTALAIPRTKSPLDQSVADRCDLEELVGRRLPFKRAVALEYGVNRAVSGLVQCVCQGHHFLFRELDSYERNKSDVVVAYGLSRVSAGQFTRLVGLYSLVAKPKWPVWIPPHPEQIPSEWLTQIEEFETGLLKQAKLSIVIASTDIINSTVMGTCSPDPCGCRWLTALGM
jgi:hypothetical protein